MQSVADLSVAVGAGGQGADWMLQGGDLLLDFGIRSTILAALFSDARRPDTAGISPSVSDPRGVWFDTASARYGSLLWLLEREALRDGIETKIRAWVQSALQFLLDRGIAKSVDIAVVRPLQDVTRIEIQIIVTRSQDEGWRTLWDAEASAVVETATATIRLLSRG